jgi:hypothetical protein
VVEPWLNHGSLVASSFTAGLTLYPLLLSIFLTFDAVGLKPGVAHQPIIAKRELGEHVRGDRPAGKALLLFRLNRN